MATIFRDWRKLAPTLPTVAPNRTFNGSYPIHEIMGDMIVEGWVVLSTPTSKLDDYYGEIQVDVEANETSVAFPIPGKYTIGPAV